MKSTAIQTPFMEKYMPAQCRNPFKGYMQIFTNLILFGSDSDFLFEIGDVGVLFGGGVSPGVWEGIAD